MQNMFWGEWMDVSDKTEGLSMVAHVIIFQKGKLSCIFISNLHTDASEIHYWTDCRISNSSILYSCLQDACTRSWRCHEVWVKQDKVEPVPPDKMVWRLSFYLSLCIKVIHLSMSRLQIELVKPEAPEEVTKPVFSQVSWAKATSPVQSQQQWRAWSWLQNRPMRLPEYMKCPSQLLQTQTDLLRGKNHVALRGLDVCNGASWLMIIHWWSDLVTALNQVCHYSEVI